MDYSNNPDIYLSMKKCAFVHCNKRGVLLHRFPWNHDLSLQWKRIVNNPMLDKKTDRQVRSYGICGDHFITSDYQTPQRLRLNRRSIPKINLGDSQVLLNSSGVLYEALCNTITDTTRNGDSSDQIIVQSTTIPENATLENLIQSTTTTENTSLENITLNVVSQDVTEDVQIENGTRDIEAEYIGPENFIEEIQLEDIRNTSKQDSRSVKVKNDANSGVNKETSTVVQDNKGIDSNGSLKNNLFTTSVEKEQTVLSYININCKTKPMEVTLKDPLYSDLCPQIIREELEVIKPLSEVDGSKDTAALMLQSVGDLQTCRICFTSGYNLVDIFQIDTDDINFYMKYRICFVDLEMEDTINHKYICEKCSLTIRQIYNFKLLCQTGNRKIYTMFKSNQLKEYCENDNEFEEDYGTQSKKKIRETDIEIEDVPIVEIFENDFGLAPGENYEFSEIEDDVSESGDGEGGDYGDWNGNNGLLPEENELPQRKRNLGSSRKDNLVVPSVNSSGLRQTKAKLPPKDKKKKLSNKENIQYKQVVADNIMNNVKLNILDDIIIGAEKMQKKITIKLSENFKITSNYMKCYFCQIQFYTLIDLKIHMKSHLSKDAKTVIKLYRCSKCEAKFLNMQSLFKHINAVHPRGLKDLKKSSYLCEKCGKKFSYRCGYRAHMLVHLKCHTCSICSKSFRYLDNLNQHVLNHTDIKIYICEYCGKSYKKKKNLQDHYSTHDIITYKKQKKKKIIRYPCNICSEEFSTERRYNNHLQTHYTPKRYKCPYEACSAQFSSKGGLRRHKQRKHVGKKNHVCNECGRSFFENNHLTKHKILHDKHAPKYPCDVCGRVFFLSETLRNHKKNHIVRPHSCVHCKKCFRDVKYLKMHISSAHSSESRECYENPLEDFSSFVDETDQKGD